MFPRKVINTEQRKEQPMNRSNKPYRLKRRKDRGGQYAIVDKATGKSKLTGTADRHQAEEQARIKYGLTDDTNAAFHKKMAEAHLAKCNSEWLTITWDMIAKRMISGPRGKCGGEKRESTVRTLESNWNNAIWNELRHKRAIDTVASDFMRATRDVGVAMTCFGKRLHNYAIDHQLIPYQIIGAEMWMKHERNPRSRAVSEEEHLKILRIISNVTGYDFRQYIRHHQGTTREQWRDEWVNWLWFLWFTGASNSDAANMKAENVKWEEGVIEYKRGKWVQPEKHAPARVAIAKGGQLEKLLKRLPQSGNLFPLLSQTDMRGRCDAFAHMVKQCGIKKGITSHGYRFAFAERARKGGMSAEDRMANLGHASYDQTHHYDKNAKVVPVSIEVIEGGLEAA